MKYQCFSCLKLLEHQAIILIIDKEYHQIYICSECYKSSNEDIK